MLQKSQQIDLESRDNVTMDRQTIYCVPIPGETTWVKEVGFENNSKIVVKAKYMQFRNILKLHVYITVYNYAFKLQFNKV